jgi:23S rRNA pseudouridine2605 synthase
MVDHPTDVEPHTPSGQGERVAKALARAGVASRREVERLIAEGRVRLNGTVLDTPAVKVGPGDILMVDGEVIAEAEGTRLWRYHKPVGLVTTHHDPVGRPTVFDALPEHLPRVISVGRLDLSSEGLLLLTNDGALARALELPANGWVRRYRARAYGPTSQAKLDELRNGITVDGVVYGPIEAKLDKVKEGSGGTNNWITLSITEGKNREVRRVLEAIGLKVNRLIRLAYGPFQLGTLAQGQVEEVGPRVIREQLSGVLPGLRPAASVRSAASATTVKASALERPAAPRRSAPAPAVPAASPVAEPEKKVRKPGWAKAKPRTGHPRPPAKPRAERAGTDLTFVPAKPRPTRTRSEPSARSPSPAGPRTPSAPRPGPRPGGGPKRRG